MGFDSFGQSTIQTTVSGADSTGLVDNATIDAFARLRVSNPQTLFESKQLFDSQPLFWDSFVEVSATVSHSIDKASTTLATTGTSGSYAIRQSKQRMNYQPGKSLAAFITFEMGDALVGNTKRVGYFDEKNGIFLEQVGTGINMVLRSHVLGSAADNRVSQNGWNLDALDGTGPSGITLDLSKTQIFFLDFEWLGVGRVRTGFVIDGIPVYAHEYLNANILDNVYMSTPNLPIRYEIKSTAATSASTLQHICSTVISEGGYEALGALRSADRGNTSITVSNTDGVVPLISLRLNPSKIGGTVVPLDFTLMSSAGATFKWALVLNPTMGGVDAVSWEDPDSSIAQYDVSRTVSNTVSGGYILKSGYNAGQGPVTTFATPQEIKSAVVLGSDITGSTDQLVLAIDKLDAGNDGFYASIAWRELV